MATRTPFWLREMLKVWMQYLAAGLAFIPAGILCVVLLNKGLTRNVALVVSVAIGLVLAYFAWKLVDNRLVLHPPLPPTSHLATAYGGNVQFQMSGLSLSGVAAAAIIVMSNANYPPPKASNLLLRPNSPGTVNEISLHMS